MGSANIFFNVSHYLFVEHFCLSWFLWNFVEYFCLNWFLWSRSIKFEILSKFICLTSVTPAKPNEKNEICRSISTCAVSVMVFFLYFNTVFNIVFNMPNINIFNTPWNFDIAFNMHYSFQHMLKFSTCCLNIVFYTYYSFQHALKFSTCFQHTLKYST